MTNCKRCSGTEGIVKDVKIREQQRYYCKPCKYHFVVGDRRQSYAPEVKAQAVLLYGTMKCSYGMIARLFKTSRKAVYMWIKKAGTKLPEPVISEDITSIELDEMWHFIQKETGDGSGKHWSVILEGVLLG